MRALSLANLCYLPIWAELLTGSRYHYFMDHAPSRMSYPAILLNTILLASVFLILGRLARRFLSERGKYLANYGFLFVVIVALNGARRLVAIVPAEQFPDLLRHTALVVFLGLVSILVLIAAVRWRNGLIHGSKAVVWILTPFVVLTFGQAIWLFLTYEKNARSFDGELAPALAAGHTAQSRVIWILFDELDEQIAFDERPAGLQLPELDRFRSESISSTHAYPVAAETTMAMPSLISGKPISKGVPVDASTLLVTLGSTGPKVSWATLPNIFADARSLGIDSALVGWFHPYCRILRGSLSACSWWSAHMFNGVGRHSDVFSMREIMINQIGAALEGIPGGSFVGLAGRFLSEFHAMRAKRDGWDLEMYRSVMNEAKKMVARADLGLELAHFPIPHAPNIFDRRKQRLIAAGNASYVDNLALVDITLGELRRVMENAGTWETSTVIVTSDHWYRAKPNKPWTSQGEGFTLSSYHDHRVPLMIKLPGQHRGVSYDTPFNTIATHDLILELLSKGNEVSDPNTVMQWIDRHRSTAPPYCDEVKDCETTPIDSLD